MSNKDVTIAQLARVVELEVSPNDPRRRFFEATCADGEVCHLMTGWPHRTGAVERIHCADHQTANVCEGAYRVGAVLCHERHLAKMHEYKKTLFGLTLGAPFPGSLALAAPTLRVMR